jgi:hypothetical protein
MSKPRILLLSDDLRMTSGISTMSREIVMGTVDRFNWVQLGAGINLQRRSQNHEGISGIHATMLIQGKSPTNIRATIEM